MTKACWNHLKRLIAVSRGKEFLNDPWMRNLYIATKDEFRCLSGGTRAVPRWWWKWWSWAVLFTSDGVNPMKPQDLLQKQWQVARTIQGKSNQGQQGHIHEYGFVHTVFWVSMPIMYYIYIYVCTYMCTVYICIYVHM